MRSYRPVGLPIDEVAGELTSALATGGAVVTAEPGAGKSSIVPLLANDALDGVIYLCEPRRVAARAAAQRLADLSGTTLGTGVGLVMRGENRRSNESRIIVMTEGVFTQIVRNDPELPGVAGVIFDEFHERSLDADLGLAMSLEARDALRPDLMISVMSATIAAEPIAELLGGAPIVTAAGRTFPVETRWFQRTTGRAWAGAVADLTARAYAEVTGSVLVFVPGRREINDVINQLQGLGLTGEPLHGGSDARVQHRLLSQSTERRIIVSTAVAETSLTIPGIEAVVDGGLARRAAYDQRTGLGRLETGYVTRFAADQRRGRAGRLRPGICFRAWSQEDERHLDDAPTPEILAGDPLELGFGLARWGDPYADALPLLDRPPRHRLDAAYHRLADLGLTTSAGALTDAGTAAATLGVHPRVGALLLATADATELTLAADVAAVLSSDQYPQSDDFEAEVMRSAKTHSREAKRIAALRVKLPNMVGGGRNLAELAAASWPDRIAFRRDGEDERYLLPTGNEVKLRRSSSLAGSEALVVVDADADPTSGFVSRALPLSRDAAIEALGPHVQETDEVVWDDTIGRVRAEQLTGYGALVFRRRPNQNPPAELVEREARGALVRSKLGLLNWSKAALETQARLAWLNEQDPAVWPDVSTDALLARLPDWLSLSGRNTKAALASIDVTASLLSLLDWQQRNDFARLAPTSLATPKGQNVAVRYDSGEPVWAVRLQWLLGLDEHPVAGPRRTPITIELLSPASRPVQRTRDLPGFWRGSYAAVRSDLRGRYPKHHWPEDPLDL